MANTVACGGISVWRQSGICIKGGGINVAAATYAVASRSYQRKYGNGETWRNGVSKLGRKAASSVK